MRDGGTSRPLSGRVDSLAHMLDRMRQAGVSVLDVKPQAMTAAVINRCLEIKRRRQL